MVSGLWNAPAVHSVTLRDQTLLCNSYGVPPVQDVQEQWDEMKTAAQWDTLEPLVAALAVLA
jgi:hypothetical protein